MKKIDTLVTDIYSVIKDKGGWDEVVNEYFLERIGDTMMSRLTSSSIEYKPSLRMSNIGSPCGRKLWYSINKAGEGEELQPHTLLKFLYGDLLEDLLLALAVAAGHTVEGCQDVMEIDGIKGHRDAVIDGVLVDVKSASPYSFKKFKEGRLREDDAFGYIGQLSSYLYSAQDDPLVRSKDRAAFLVIDKVNGHICLDTHDLRKDMAGIRKLVADRKEMVAKGTPPPRSFKDKPEGKSGNKKLGVNCSYCEFKMECWPGLRTFVYSNGPTYLTTVKFTPKVKEV